MKRNTFLRLAVCLLLAALMGTSVFTTSLAKYVATATVGAEARVANFSFVTNAAPNANPAGEWQQIAVDAGRVTRITQDIPLFDTQYKTLANDGAWFNGPAVDITVKSSNTDPVVAPGIGVNFGEGVSKNGYAIVSFRNDSEVAVRFKLSVDAAASSLFGVPLYLHPLTKGEGWMGASGCVLSGTLAADWTYLAPSSPATNIEFGFFLPFDADGCDSYGGYTFSLWNWLHNELKPTPIFNDVRDSMLGYYAARYLKAIELNASEGDIADYLDECQLKIVLKLEVEQVD